MFPITCRSVVDKPPAINGNDWQKNTKNTPLARHEVRHSSVVGRVSCIDLALLTSVQRVQNCARGDLKTRLALFLLDA